MVKILCIYKFNKTLSIRLFFSVMINKHLHFFKIKYPSICFGQDINRIKVNFGPKYMLKSLIECLFFFSLKKNPVNYRNILKRDTILNARARGRYRCHSAVTNRKCPLQRKQQVEVNLFDQSEARISDAA